MNDDVKNFIREKPVVVAVLASLITAFVTTTFNDYLAFKEQDALIRVQLSQLRQEVGIYKEFLKRERDQREQALRRELDIRITKIKENSMESDASLRREMEQFRIFVDNQYRLHHEVLWQLSDKADKFLIEHSKSLERVNNLEREFLKEARDDRGK